MVYRERRTFDCRDGRVCLGLVVDICHTVISGGDGVLGVRVGHGGTRWSIVGVMEEG